VKMMTKNDVKDKIMWNGIAFIGVALFSLGIIDVVSKSSLSEAAKVIIILITLGLFALMAKKVM